MKPEQFQREVSYGASLAIAKVLLRRELITSEEYYILQTELIRKYRPVVSSLNIQAQQGEKGEP